MLKGRPRRVFRGAAAWMIVLALVSGSAMAQAVPKGNAKAKAKTGTVAVDYVDRMIQEGWEEAKIKPSKVAQDAEFMRRAYLDLLGRIPNVREATAYLDNKDPAKRAKLVEYLLAHPDYAKNFATIWSINLIGRKNQGRDVDRAALATWLRRQFTDNRPWDKMVYDLVTATGSNKDNGAVNFTLAHMEQGAVNLTSMTTRLFLGQQIQCAQCHDHPKADWKQADFWGINAFFKGIKSERVRAVTANGTLDIDHIELSDNPTDAYATFEKRSAVVGIAFPTYLDGRKISQNADVNRREALGKFITEPTNNDFAKSFVNRMWAHFMGRGFVNPVDDFGPQNPPSHPELLDKLATEFKTEGYDVKKLIKRIMATQAYNLTSATLPINEKDESLFSHVTLKPMTPEQLFESLLVATSAHRAGGGEDTSKRRDAWLNQFIFTFGNDDGEESNTFQGTIPQALMMMNGELMDKAVGCKPGSFLADLLEQANLQHRVTPEVYMVNHLFLAALSRYPTSKELNASGMFLGSNPDTIQVMEDLFWALLNSNEFVLNR